MPNSSEATALDRETALRAPISYYASEVSRGRVKWNPYRWLVFLSKLVRRRIVEGGARLIVNAPPRHGKSSFISHWVPTWFLDWFPERRVILASYGADLANAWSRKVRDEFLLNPQTWTKLKGDSKAVSTWETEKGGGMVAAGVGGPITGRGGDLVIIDDPHKNWEEATSAVYRAKVIDWYKSTLYTRLEPGASLIIVQTRWHENDLTGYLLEEDAEKWELVRLPAIAEEGVEDPLGREPGEALCPERYSTERLEQIQKVMTSILFAGLYQQRPVPLLGGMAKRNWFKYWTELPVFDEQIQTWDLTFKATGTSFVVGSVWGRAGASVYLLDRVRLKAGFLEQVQAIKQLSIRYPEALSKYIEDAADAQAVKASLDAEVPGIILRPARGSKEARLAAVLGAIEAGNVFLPARAEWLDEFLGEVTAFPGSLNDDQVDVLTMALDVLIEKAYESNFSLPGGGERPNPWKDLSYGIA